MTPAEFKRLKKRAAGFKKSPAGVVRKPNFKRGLDIEVRNKSRSKTKYIEEYKKQESTYFVVLGDPFGYYSHGARPNWKRKTKYHEYLKMVRDFAEVSCIQLPLKATNKNPCYIHTVAYFATGTHSDPENVRKGIVDALFYNKEFKGIGDKHVGGSFSHPLYDAENPRVEVRIDYPCFE